MEIFDTNSIEANKQGKKSEKQIKEIKEAVNPGIWLYGGLGVLLLGGCGYAAIASMQAGGALNALGLVLAAVGLFATLRGLTTWNLRRKLLKAQVQAGEGTVTFKVQTGLNEVIDVDRYISQTNDGKRLHPVGLAGVDRKLPPGNYRFYYLEPRSWLLEPEPLSTEEEMRFNMNDVLATAQGYDLTFLENCRQEARAGRLKTVEMKPKLDSHEETIPTTNTRTQSYSCTLGDIQFPMSNKLAYALIEAIPHRFYSREGENFPVAVEVA